MTWVIILYFDLEQISSPTAADLTARRKLKKRYKNGSLSEGASSASWTETVPLNTKESVMGPLESFLRSINCYPEHDQHRNKKDATAKKPSLQIPKKYPTSLLQPSSPPPLGENADNVQPSSSNGFSWTPSLLSQRRPNKNNKGQEVSKPEKDAKNDRWVREATYKAHSYYLYDDNMVWYFMISLMT